MHADHAVVDFAATAQPLPSDADGMAAAFGRCRFVQIAKGLGMGVLAGQQLLAVVANADLLPLDRFHETL